MKCPFLKVSHDDISTSPVTRIEEFQECIEEGCIAWRSFGVMGPKDKKGRVKAEWPRIVKDCSLTRIPGVV